MSGVIRLITPDPRPMGPRDSYDYRDHEVRREVHGPRPAAATTGVGLPVRGPRKARVEPALLPARKLLRVNRKVVRAE